MRRAVTTLLVMFVCPLGAFSDPPPPPPNIIFFLADDMGMGDTSAYQDWTGNSDSAQLSTPAMDRLAETGVRFTDAHSPSSRAYRPAGSPGIPPGPR